MKLTAMLLLILALTVSSHVFAQSGGMQGMDMKDMDMMRCMDMKGMQDKGMKGKDMDAQKCKDMMKGMDQKRSDNSKATHRADATVKNVDAASGKVTLSHAPVKSLGRPAMTMGFMVKDKALFDKLAVGKNVEFEFVQQGSDYVVTTVK